VKFYFLSITACKALVIAALSLEHKHNSNVRKKSLISHTGNTPYCKQKHKLNTDLAAMRNNNDDLLAYGQ